MRLRFASFLVASAVLAGCTPRKMDVAGLDGQAAFYCDSGSATSTSRMWISGRPLVFGPDPKTDFVSDLSQNAPTVQVVGDTLRVFVSRPLAVPPQSSVPFVVDQVVVEPFRLLYPDSLASEERRSSFLC